MTGMVGVEREKGVKKEDLYIYGMVPRVFYQTGKHLVCWQGKRRIILTTHLQALGMMLISK